MTFSQNTDEIWIKRWKIFYCSPNYYCWCKNWYPTVNVWFNLTIRCTWKVVKYILNYEIWRSNSIKESWYFLVKGFCKFMLFNTYSFLCLEMFLIPSCCYLRKYKYCLCKIIWVNEQSSGPVVKMQLKYFVTSWRETTKTFRLETSLNSYKRLDMHHCHVNTKQHLNVNASVLRYHLLSLNSRLLICGMFCCTQKCVLEQ